ncbi:hypothetical protein [Neobacillus bataviensis]|nr:hypothetical protein [Neobacillus bataviensis]
MGDIVLFAIENLVILTILAHTGTTQVPTFGVSIFTDDNFSV